jgi:hypothetical protein
MKGWQGAIVAAMQRTCRQFRQNSVKSGLYPGISRLEPDCELGQKGAVSRFEAGKRHNAFSLVSRAEVLVGAVAERLPRPRSASEAGKKRKCLQPLSDG